MEIIQHYDGKKHRTWVVVDFGDFHHATHMNGYESGSVNTLITAFDPDDFHTYFKDTVQEIVYTKK